VVDWNRNLAAVLLVALLAAIGGESSASAYAAEATNSQFDRLVAKLEGKGTEAMMAARSLGLMGDRRALEHLTPLAKSKAYSIRMTAIIALGELGDPRATDTVMAALTASDSHMRAAAAEALGRIGSRKATPGVSELLKDDLLSTRLTAARALAALADPRAIRPLALALNDDEPEMQIASARALGAIGKPWAEGPLARLLGHDNTPVRRAALAAIRALEGNTPATSPQPIERWVTLLTHDYPQQRAYAVRKLGQSGNPQAVAPLIAALDDRRADVFFGASLWLARLGGDEAITTLLGILKTTHSPRRWTSAAAALAERKEKRAVPVLLETMLARRFDVDVAQAGLVALGGIGDKSAVAALLKLQADSPKLRLCNTTLIGVLARLGHDESWTVILESVKAPQESLRRQGATWLGYTQNARATKPLITLLSDPDASVRAMAAAAIANIPRPTPAAKAALTTALEDPDSSVRNAAANALKRFNSTP